MYLNKHTHEQKRIDRTSESSACVSELSEVKHIYKFNCIALSMRINVMCTTQSRTVTLLNSKRAMAEAAAAAAVTA